MSQEHTSTDAATSTPTPAVRPPRPSAPAVVIEGIPPEIISIPRWVAWRYKWKSGKWTKAPINARTGRGAASTDANTWSDFETAWSYYQRHRSASSDPIDGVGFVLNGDGIVGIDLDDCLDAAGQPKPWARPILDALDAYTEVSPSGEGVKLLMRSNEPFPGTHCKQNPFHDGEVEFYQTGRYFTVTGRRLEPYARTEIVERTEAAAALYRHVFAAKLKKQESKRPRPIPPSDLESTDAEIIAHLKRCRCGLSFIRLWSGDASEVANDLSRADHRLCSLLAWRVGPDADRIDALFRQSGLMREKWDSRRGTSTYGRNTVVKAIESRTRFYGGNSNGVTRDGRRSREDGAATPPPPATRASEWTDASNAQALVDGYGARIRHCHPWGKWLVWDGRQWSIDLTAQTEAWAKTTLFAMREVALASVVELTKLAATQEGDDAKATEVLLGRARRHLDWAKKSQFRARISAMIALAGSEPGIPILTKEMDPDPMSLNVANGIVDLRTGRLRAHDATAMHTKLANVNFNEQAPCPQFERYLATVFPATGDASEEAGNQPLIDFLQRFLGYCLTGSVSEQVFAILYGTGSNGKSVLLNLLSSIMGEYACKMPASFLLASSQERHPTETADLFGTRLAFGSEPDDGWRLDEARIKEMTGGDEMTARRMREDFWRFMPSHKFVWSANHKPEVRGTDHGFWRRVMLIPFTQRFWNPDTPPAAGEERPNYLRQDKALVDKLMAERSGILAWLVRGCLEWQRNGLRPPSDVIAATKSYREEQDRLARFITDGCVVDTQLKVRSSEMFAAYKRWADAGNERPISQTKFGKAIEEAGFSKSTSNGVWYLGLGLQNVNS